MNQEIIDNINSCVKPEDELWILGDISINAQSINYLRELQCNYIVVVSGNHDYVHPMHLPRNVEEDFIKKEKRKEEINNTFLKRIEAYKEKTGVKEIHHNTLLTLSNNTTVRVNHFPYKDYGDARFPQWRPIDDGRWLVCGHVHQNWRQHGNQINVGIDAWGGMPVTEQQVINLTASIKDLPAIRWK